MDFPDALRSVGMTAFYGCLKLASVSVLGRVETVGDDVFTGCSPSIKFEYPDDETRKVFKKFEENVLSKAFSWFVSCIMVPINLIVGLLFRQGSSDKIQASGNEVSSTDLGEVTHHVSSVGGGAAFPPEGKPNHTVGN